jgi:hypothetical protein
MTALYMLCLILTPLVLGALGLLFVAARGTYRWYVANRPRRMATPWHDPRDALREHWRIVGRK